MKRDLPQVVVPPTFPEFTTRSALPVLCCCSAVGLFSCSLPQPSAAVTGDRISTD